MKRSLPGLILLVLAIAFSPESAGAQADLRTGSGALSGANTNKGEEEPAYRGQPLSYWLKSIRDRDPENIEMAFDAIVELGPAAWRAVPELTRIVQEPFAAIQYGKDSRSTIHTKLLNIHLRAAAIDGLGAIGEAAADSAESVIRWGLTVRVLPGAKDPSPDAVLITLIGIDVLERMRVAGAVSRFGPGASDAVQKLVESPDNEERKFSAAILNDETVLIATDLMSSQACGDRARGLSLLSAMWPVVAKDHLITLKAMLECLEIDPSRSLPATNRQTGPPFIKLKTPSEVVNR